VGCDDFASFYDYRIICDIQDQRLRIVVVELGHRRDVYR